MSNNIEFIIIDDIMESFRKVLVKQKGSKVIGNEDNGYGYNCDFVIIPGACPMKYGKCGWTECGKCFLNYNCCCATTSAEFQEFLKTQNCRADWLNSYQLGVWIKI